MRRFFLYAFHFVSKILLPYHFDFIYNNVGTCGSQKQFTQKYIVYYMETFSPF